MKVFLSLGAGVQSSTMALMAAKKELGYTPDCAIFADTQWEPSYVYEWLDYLETQLPFPLYRVSAGSLRDAVLTPNRGFIPIPAYTDQGLGRRQCTREYKIEPINRLKRQLLGYSRGERAEGVQCLTLIGISTDEASRMRSSKEPWNKNIYPLIELGMSRADCLQWLKRNGYPIPPKSACIGCPFRSNDTWLELKKHPKDWEDAVAVDNAIRFSKQGTTQYLHFRKRPLAEVVDDSYEQINLFDDLFQMECEGMCGL